MKIEKSLHGEIETRLQELKDLKVGTDEHKAAVDTLTKLLDRAIEIDKINIEHEEKSADREVETDLQLAKMEEEKKDRFARNAITIGSISVNALLLIWGTLKTFQFEKDGSVTSLIGRNIIGNFSKIFCKK